MSKPEKKSPRSPAPQPPSKSMEEQVSEASVSKASGDSIQELDSDAPLVCNQISETQVQIGETDHNTFTFDRIFYPSATQSELFECVGEPIVSDVLTGYNGTVLAYGQTGSGKTFTMMGELEEPEQAGLIPRAAAQIFSTIMSSDPDIIFTIKCSMLEIYKETLRDLMCPDQRKLKIKEGLDGIQVEGLMEDYVGNEEELMEKIEAGQENRSVASTRMNSRSSRSHQLFILKVHQQLPDGLEKTGTLNLVDLAGSEKISMSGVTGNKLEETKKINLSLSMLGHVIHSLSNGASHIPYRDSKLTRLLQESLGGNFKTRLVVTCSPHIRNIEESLTTLKFAQRAKTVKTKAVMNVREAPEKVISRLRCVIDSQQLEEAYAYIDQLKKGLGRSHVRGVVEEKSDPSSVRRASYLISNREELDADLSSAESDSGRFPDIQKNWETLRLEHAKELEHLHHQIAELISEKEKLKQKVLLGRQENRKLERFMMDYIDRTQKHRISVISPTTLLRKNDEIAILQSQVRSLTRCLIDYERRNNVWEDCGKDFIEMEEVVSLKSSLAVIDEVETYGDLNPTTSQTVTHTVPVEGELLTTLSSCPDDQVFNLANQISQYFLLRMTLINFHMNRALSAKNWRFSLLEHKFQIEKIQNSSLTERLRDMEKVMNCLFEICKEFDRNVETHDRREETPHPLILKPFSQRSLAKHITSSPMLPRDFIRYGIRNGTRGTHMRREHLTIKQENEPSISPHKLLKVLHLNSSMQDQRLQSALQQCEVHEETLRLIETQIYATHKKELAHWNRILSDVKENYDNTLSRLERKILKLNGTLAMWVNQYMDLQRILQDSTLQKPTEETAELVSTKMKTVLRLLERTELVEKGLDSLFSPRVLCEPMMKIENLRGDENLLAVEED